MFNNVVLDVFIGLIFVYLLYSLLTTIVQEVIASFLNLRAVVLVKAIRVMLEDRKPLDLKSNSYLGKLLERIVNSIKTQKDHLYCRLPDDTLAKAFYKHPSIKYLSANSLRSKPSYIESQNFSATLIKMLRGKDYDGSVPQIKQIYNTLYASLPGAEKKVQIIVGQTADAVKAEIQTETLDQLKQLYVDAEHDIERFKILLENWFEEMMDRANGWYKRQTRRILFFLGLIIAIYSNVDTIKIYNILSKDKTARDQLVQIAIQSHQKYEAAIERIKDTTRNANDTGKNKKDTATNINLLTITTRDTLLDQAYKDVQKDVEKSNQILAMGWHSSPNYKKLQLLDSLQKTKKDSLKLKGADSTGLTNRRNELAKQADELRPLVYDKFDGFSSILGWLITALALTLGAPFWFDLLNKFIRLRAAGVKPEEEENGGQKPVPKSNASLHTVPGAATAGAGIQQQAVAEDQAELVPDEAENANTAQG